MAKSGPRTRPEPIIRECVLRLSLRDEALSTAAHAGRWWRRDGLTEVDIVIGDRSPTAKAVLAVGSIKWRPNQPFDPSDVRDVARLASQVPGATDHVDLVAVSRVPGQVDGLARQWGPDDLHRRVEIGLANLPSHVPRELAAVRRP